ncbi:MAG: TolC family protein [Sulfuricurvum sp.]|uniref:TolC family protein n=1 Tax=Sulfuricurvum sp. TaxID=2025608 RepID=UPI00261D0C20|nr:TolC family protein [Sulfuricurvum sp.]MDD2368761.1 TolC family protein [Sulfuricurvum sp.]MDD5119332.1 TolC family protein [Sulfuricurvum sp.]
MRHFVLLSFTLLPLIASDLASLLPSAKTNLRVASARLEIQKSQAQLDEAKTAYFPTVSATALYKKKDRTPAFEPNKIQGAEIGAQISVFDGFRREALLDALHASMASATHSLAQEEQNVLMETIAAYYDYLDTQDRLKVNQEKKKELLSEVERYKILVQNDLATTDILKSLIASKLEADYDEQNLKMLLEKHRKHLELLSATPIHEPLQYRELAMPRLTSVERHDLQSDQANIDILHNTEDRYTYLPTLTLEAKHKYMEYSGYDTMGGTNLQPLNQNEITASLTMTLFDMGRIAKEREQARIDTLKAKNLLDYKTQSLNNDAEIALMSIQTSQHAYEAAKAEEEARSEAFGFIKQRFEAGLVNTTTYLSELTNLTYSRAKAHNALNTLQVAKASAAYAYGIDLMTLIEEKK